MRRLFMVVVCILLTACGNDEASNVDRIVLYVSRRAIVGLFQYNPTYIIRADGLGDSSINLPPGLEDEPEWSLDGHWIVFSTLLKEGGHAGGSPKIYLMHSDGSNRKRITDGLDYEINPSWSPDGQHIAYATKGKIGILNVQCMLRGEECNPDPLLLNEGRSPDWSPDGRRIVYASYSLEYGIYVVNADGTGNPMNVASALRYCRHPRWSPDGQKIVFSCAGTIYLVSGDGSGLTKLRGNGGDPSWSPDGKKIAYVGPHEHTGNCLGEPCPSDDRYADTIFLMNADGSNPIRLSNQDDENVLWYSWLPKHTDAIR
jgi:Tol biopolymer transport system component